MTFPPDNLSTARLDDEAARNARELASPYTVATGDIRELRAALEPARHAPCPRSHPAGQAPPAHPLQAAAS